MNTTMKIIGGFLAGAAIGAASGILMAPHSGKKTRKKMLDSSRRISKDVTKSVNESLAGMRQAYNTKVDDLARKSKSILENAKESVKV